MGTFSFHKQERLCSRKDIQELFEQGSSFYLHPFKVFSRPSQQSVSDEVLISVSSRFFPRAVDRNTIKRRIRESYRLHKRDHPENPVHLALVYSAKEILPQSAISKKIIEVMKRIRG